MTRVLYWNIENFAFNKIANPQTGKRQRGGGLVQADAAQNRRWYVRQVLNAAAADIIVVVEVETAYDGRGRLTRGAGGDGCIELLREIRAAYNNQWMLVPPIQTGPRESVAVFYRSTRRYFAGPYVWPGGAAGVAAAPGAATGAYPALFNNRLPNRLVPAGALQNAATNERRCAARVAFTYRANHPTNANAAIDWGFSRAPYMVSFAETDGAVPPNVLRNLTLFAIHAPAAYVFADTHLRLLADVAQIYAAPGGNEVRLVIGDFNINLLRGDLTEAGAYGPLQATAGYTLALRPANPLPPNLQGYQGYFATHIRRQFSAGCWSTQGNPVYYPGYDYIGSDIVAGLYAIDNAFTRYGGGGGAANFTILNAIARSPLQVGGAYGAGPPGTVPMPRLVDQPPPASPAYPPAQGPQHTPGLRAAFQGWAEYGYIRSTSDHLPLVIDI